VPAYGLGGLKSVQRTASDMVEDFEIAPALGEAGIASTVVAAIQA